MSNVVHITVDGLKVSISTNNVHIEDSYRVCSFVDIKNVLRDIEESLTDNHITMDNPFNHRSICSMAREWLTHNNLYNLKLWVESTRSTDLNYPQKWYMNILYFIGSLIIV